MKNCKPFKKQLTDYLYGELGDAAKAAMDGHLAECETCRAELDELRATLRLLDEALDTAPAPEALNPWRSLRRPVYVPKNRFEQVWFSPQFKSALAAGALASIFLLISGSVIVFRYFPETREPVEIAVEFEKSQAARPKLAVDKRSVPDMKPDLREMAVSKPSPEPVVRDIPMPSPKAIVSSSSTAGQGFAGIGFSSSGMNTFGSGKPGAHAVHTEQYDWIPENAFQMAMDNPLSTFSIDVDRASYANVRRFLNDNQLPPVEAVRIEEMLNYFDYDYPQPVGEDPFAIAVEVGRCPWNGDHELAMVGLQGVKVDTRDLPPNNLVFLLDVSGSMNEPAKLPLLKSALRLLVGQLRPEDRVSIVVYAGAAGMVLEPTADKARIADAIERLEAGGSTAGGAGIELAYQVAQRSFLHNGNNRVILATDGDFNVGVSSDRELVKLIEQKRNKGIYLTVLGFGTGNLKDSKMEKLADKGNGNYAYIDDILEAKKTLVNEMGGTLLTIAKDVKIQIEFNPAQVKAYRLIGYENRVMAHADFDNDKKDAGELGAGHSVTALYELIPSGSAEAVPREMDLKYQRTQLVDSDDLMTVKLRYKQPDGDMSKLLVRAVNATEFRGRPPTANFRFASDVAEFGLLLRDSEFKGNANYERIIQQAKALKGEDPEGYRAEFIRMVEKARLLDRDQ